MSWNPGEHSYISAGAATALNGNLSGTEQINGVYPGNIETDTADFTVFGAISGLNTIMKGAVVDIFKK